MLLNNFFKKRSFLLLLVIGLFACTKQEEGTNGMVNDVADSIPVETHILQTGEVVDVVQATGTLFPLHDVLVSSETSGKIVRIHAEVGDLVRKGSLLVQIDPELKELALQQAEATLIETKAAYEKAVKDFERNSELFENKDISEYIFENIELQKLTAEAAYLKAQANMKMARRQLNDASIVSPVNGFVAARMVELGNSVAPGAPVAKVVDISKVKVKIGIAAKDIVKIKRNQKATVSVVAYEDEVFHGKVTAVGPQADLSTRTFPVEILIENSNYKLKAGMAAKVEITSQTIHEVPLLPKSAILERAGETIIFVVKDGVAQKRIAKLGLESGENIALLDGAVTGEEVVILGQENLSDGVTVEVKGGD